jgi:hypothetical protein
MVNHFLIRTSFYNLVTALLTVLLVRAHAHTYTVDPSRPNVILNCYYIGLSATKKTQGIVHICDICATTADDAIHAMCCPSRTLALNFSCFLSECKEIPGHLVADSEYDHSASEAHASGIVHDRPEGSLSNLSPSVTFQNISRNRRSLIRISITNL